MSNGYPSQSETLTAEAAAKLVYVFYAELVAAGISTTDATTITAAWLRRTGEVVGPVNTSTPAFIR